MQRPIPTFAGSGRRFVSFIGYSTGIIGNARMGFVLAMMGPLPKKITASEFDAISIAVNGYVANLISAGRNLADYMDSVLKGGGRLEKGRDRIPDTKKRQCANTKKSKLIIFCMS